MPDTTNFDEVGAAVILEEAKDLISEVQNMLYKSAKDEEDEEDEEEKQEEPYLCIVAWGLVMLSFGYYVDSQVRKAQLDKAPKDAYSWDSDEDRWHTMSEDLKNDHVRSLMDTYLSVLKRETA